MTHEPRDPGPDLPDPDQAEPDRLEPDQSDPDRLDADPPETDLLDPDQQDLAAEEPAPTHEAHHRGPLTRTYDLLRQLPHLPLNTRRGVVLFAFLVTGTALAAGYGAMGAVHYSESIGFCSLCHSMAPEEKGLAASAHANVTCGECHVSPGVGGFVKAKLNGTRQLVEYVTGTFPKPIPPADHAAMPKTEDTCLACHTLNSITAGGGPTQLILRPSFAEDEQNTRTTVAVLLRPTGVGSRESLSVHWHVEKQVDYVAGDERRQSIDLVEFKNSEGQKETYISGAKVRDSLNAQADVDALKAAEKTHTMDCLDCHNRVGHPLKSPGKAVDEAMAAGKIDPTLPWIKRDALAVLNKNYATTAEADAAMTAFGTAYPQRYALKGDAGRPVADVVATMKSIYAESATPEMKVVASTYPDNLGHQNSPGCFRCHDGAHFRVVDGKVTTETIPSTCATCHTFPQAGLDVNNVPLGTRPASHADKLWVFNHKTATNSQLPSGTSCGTCHAPSYCSNCHTSGAIKVDHDTMLYNHAQSVRVAGGTQSCAYCHQPAYCAQCHKTMDMKPNPLSHLEAHQ
jgi:nitrate/TMAO reductase-like tetraheme cytochrome c subunit